NRDSPATAPCDGANVHVLAASVVPPFTRAANGTTSDAPPTRIVTSLLGITGFAPPSTTGPCAVTVWPPVVACAAAVFSDRNTPLYVRFFLKENLAALCEFVLDVKGNSSSAEAIGEA